jgi:hypothetical protein
MLLHSPPIVDISPPHPTDSLIPVVPEEGDAAAIINRLLAAIIQQRRLLDVNNDVNNDVRLHY